MPSTHPYIPRLALIFDFDRTLATDTIDAFCAAWGISRAEWERDYFDPLGDGWDDIIKRAQALIDCGRGREEDLSGDFLDRVAAKVELFPGVRQLRQRLERAGRAIVEDLRIELVILSSGFCEIIRRTDVADIFDQVWAGAFHFDEQGTARAIKRIIGHAEKALYIESYAKGLDLYRASDPQTQKPGYDVQDMHVPFDQIVYIGDGLSDLNSFEFLAGRGGLSIAVDKDHDFDLAGQQTETQRVDNLAPPDYTDGGEMLESLCHAVRSAASRVALRRFADGE